MNYNKSVCIGVRKKLIERDHYDKKYDRLWKSLGGHKGTEDHR